MIHVTEDWYIDADSMGYTVGRRKKRKDKKTGEDVYYFQSPKYPTTTGHALQIIINEMIREKVAAGKIQTLIEYREELVKIYNKVMKGAGDIDAV